MKIHMGASIDGLLELSNKKLGRLTEMDGEKARIELMIKQLNGEKYIPCGDCDNFDPIEGCRGHES